MISISISVQNWSIHCWIDHKKNWSIDRSFDQKNKNKNPCFNHSILHNCFVYFFIVLFSLEHIFGKNCGGTNTTYGGLSLIPEMEFQLIEGIPYPCSHWHWQKRTFPMLFPILRQSFINRQKLHGLNFQREKWKTNTNNHRKHLKIWNNQLK